MDVKFNKKYMYRGGNPDATVSSLTVIGQRGGGIHEALEVEYELKNGRVGRAFTSRQDLLEYYHLVPIALENK